VEKLMFHLIYLSLLLGEIKVIDSADFSDKMQKVAVAATVKVENRSDNSVGSGIILGRRGAFVYILTAGHIVEGGRDLEISTFTEATYPKPCKTYHSVRIVAQTHDMRDLALLRVVTDDSLPSTLSLCPVRLLPEEGMFDALVVGCSQGKEPTCAVAVVAGKKKIRRETEEKGNFFWEVDRKQPAGSSGGPLVDKRGRLLGVCSGTNKDQSYYCHPDEIRAFLKKNGFDWLL
jgi:S1-C subfamily serine protease